MQMQRGLKHMNISLRSLTGIGVCALVCLVSNTARTQESRLDSGFAPAPVAEYVLGARDKISIWALAPDELNSQPVTLDAAGYVTLPLLGRVHAGGLTTEQLGNELARRLSRIVNKPEVSVSIVEYRSQPVSILGAVNKPGVYQLEGNKTLVEALSTAEGLRKDAGSTIEITRRATSAAIPLRSARQEGNFIRATIDVRTLVDGTNPKSNILLQPNDVITVPRAQLVYVVGEVEKPGGFPLEERESISVLQALSMAGGLSRTSAPGQTRILRQSSPGERTEIHLDLRKILAGKNSDVALQREDILFIPTNTGKKVSLRVIEAAIQTGTGIAIWRR